MSLTLLCVSVGVPFKTELWLREAALVLCSCLEWPESDLAQRGYQQHIWILTKHRLDLFLCKKKENSKTSPLSPGAASDYYFFLILSSHHCRTIIMCHVIVTCRSMLWTLFSIVVAFAELIAFMSPDWLMGFSRSDYNTSRAGADAREYRPSLGLYSRCLRIGNRGIGVSCGPYAGTFGEVASGFWQAAMLFLAAGTLVLGGVACISIFSLCFQSILKKSLFNICGLLQAVAGKTASRKMFHSYILWILWIHI